MTWLVLLVVAAVFATVAVAGCVALLMVQRPWRAQAIERFEVGCPTAEARELIARYAADRPRWRLADADADELHIRTGTTWTTWRMDLDVSLHPSPGGTDVQITARCPQLVDYGDSRRAISAIRGCLPARAGALARS